MARRTSALPFSEFCGRAPALMEAHGAGRSAVKSTAFHALAADPGSADTRVKFARLTREEQEEITGWLTPADLEVDGLTLRYSDARKEATVSLDARGAGYLGEPVPGALTVGHADMYWVVGDTVYVGDIKRSTYTVSDGADSLQLHGYGFALALALGCKRYRPLIWAAEEGEWIVGDMVALESFKAADIWARIQHAATNTGEAAPGAHCMGCYGKAHCPEFLLPAMEASENLQAFMVGGPPMTDAAAVAGLQLATAMEEAAKVLREQGRTYTAQRCKGVLRDPAGSGKKFLRVLMPGKKSGLSVADIQARFGADAPQYIKQGKPYEVYKWVSDKGGQ